MDLLKWSTPRSLLIILGNKFGYENYYNHICRCTFLALLCGADTYLIDIVGPLRVFHSPRHVKPTECFTHTCLHGLLYTKQSNDESIIDSKWIFQVIYLTLSRAFLQIIVFYRNAFFKTLTMMF